MAFAETQELAVKLDLKGNFKAGLRDASRALQGFDRATSRTQQSLGKFGSNIQRGVAVGLTATAAGFGAVVKAASDYESAFAGVRKTVSATEPQLAALSDSFRKLAKEIPISAAELARLGEAGGALGVQTEQLEEFVRVTALLGVTTDLTADQAADSLGVLSNVLKLTGKEYGQFASALVALGNAGASTESQIIQIAERSGAAGELIGITTEQVLGFGSAVASLGIEAEAGGSALQKFYLESSEAVFSGGAALKRFSEVAGVSAKAFKKAFQEDAGEALQDFLEGLGKLSQADQIATLKELGFNDIRITRTLLGLANNTKLVSDQMGVANRAFKENTALTKEADERFKTFDSQLQLTKNTLTDMAITIGSKLLPKIAPLLKRLNDFINANQGNIEAFGDKLASGFEKFADALGKVDWKPFIDGLRLTSQIAKTAIDLFMALPAEVKAVAIGAFAVNKVTGGLPTSIAKDVGGALLQQFAARGSSPANPMWVASVGGLPGAPGGASGGGGALRTAATGAALVITPIAATIGAREGLNAAFPNMQIAQNGLDAAVANAEAARANAQATQSVAEVLGPPTPVRKGVLVPPDVLDRGGQGSNTGGQSAFLTAIIASHKGIASVLSTEFRGMIAALKSSKTPAEIKAAVAKAVNIAVEQGRGNVESTKTLIATLKTQLKNTSDPETRRVLAAAIAKVQAKIPGREFVAKQIVKADGILTSNRTTAQKIEALKGIQRDLGGKSVAAQKAVAAKIEAAKQQQLAAQWLTTLAIRNKDLSVTTNTTVNTSVSLRTIVNGQRVYSSYGSTAVARSGGFHVPS